MKRSRRVRFLGISVVFVTAIAAASIASADNWVHVNFDANTYDRTDLVGPAGGGGETWNQDSMAGNPSLLDSTGASTTMGWSIAPVTNGAVKNSTWSDPTSSMMKGNIWVNDAYTYNLTISGLDTSAKYDLYIAAWRGLWNTTTMSYSTTNATTTSSPQETVATIMDASWVLNETYVVFEEMVPDGAGNIIVSSYKASGSYGFWCGFQLREIVVSTSVDLDNDTVASNAVPGTLVGTISDPLGHATSFVLTNAPAGGSAAENDKFQITDGTNLRTRVWMSQYSNDISIAGISNGVALVTNSLPITLTAAGNPVFRVSAETSNPPSDGDVVGTMMVDNDSGATFAIVAGRTDLFTQDGNDNLLVTNAASWTGVGSTNWVTIRATTGTGTSDLAIGVSVVSGVASGTVFRFM